MKKKNDDDEMSSWEDICADMEAVMQLLTQREATHQAEVLRMKQERHRLALERRRLVRQRQQMEHYRNILLIGHERQQLEASFKLDSPPPPPA